MRDSLGPYGAAAGAVGVALYLAGALVAGERPAFHASGREVAAYFAEERTALRIGTLFTTEGAFAADGVLGLYFPVVAAAGWVTIASVVLTRKLRAHTGGAPPYT